MHDGIGQLFRRIIEQFVDHVAAIGLQIRRLPDGFFRGERAAAHRAALARLHNFVGHTELVRDVERIDAVAGIVFLFRAEADNGRNQNVIRAQILREPQRGTVVFQRTIQCAQLAIGIFAGGIILQ